MAILFEAKGLLGHVDGTLMLDAAEEDSKKVKQWKTNDAKAKLYILSTVDEQAMAHLLTCTTASEMNEKLKKVYQKSNDQQKHHLLQEYYSYQFAKGKSVLDNISHIQTLVHQLATLKEIINEQMVISKIISILPKEYKHFTSAWDSVTAAERTLENFCARLQTEESKMKVKPENTSVAFRATLHSKFKSDITCFKCQQKGHVQKNCTKLTCKICKKTNHKEEDCYFKNKACSICKKTNHAETDCFFRDKNKAKSNFQRYAGKNQKTHSDVHNAKRRKLDGGESKVAFLTGTTSDNVSETLVKSKSKNWCDGDENLTLLTDSKRKNHLFVVDSGSTGHMTNDPQLLTEVKYMKDKITVAKRNMSMDSLGVGTAITDKCNLTHVQYVPDLTKNLLSVSAVTHHDGAVYFDKHGVKILKTDIQVPTEVIVLEGSKTSNGLYVVNLKNEKEVLLTHSKNKTVLWHRKMGHLGPQNLKKLLTLSDGIKLDGVQCQEILGCEVCMEAKQSKTPHKITRERASRILEIIHTDVCGPISPETHESDKYYVTFIDDYSHFCQVYLMKNKSDVPDVLRQYVREVENQHDRRVHKIRCDNGGEYIKKELQEWCKFKGIVMDFSVPRCPQLNGTAERMNRTILDRARAILFDSGLDKEMWGEAVRTAVYLINRSPSVTVERTPMEMWTGKRPDLSRLQIFGAKVHAKVTTHLRKLDKRSQPAIFIGYGTNGYRLWDSNKRKVFMSHDVMASSNVQDNLTSMENIRYVPSELNEIEQDQYNQMSSDDGTEEETIQNNANPEEENDNNQNYPYQLRERRTLQQPKRYEDYEIYICEDQPTYEQCRDDPHWKAAIEDEMKSLESNATWTLVDSENAKGKEKITSKWLFKRKNDGRYKARLVARGCQQKGSLDYKDTFSSVVQISTLRILLATAAIKHLNIYTFDIKSAFLHGNLHEEIYMTLPEGYDHPGKICLLQKALYGLKQAPLQWHLKLTTFLKQEGLEQLKSDQCVFKTSAVKPIMYVAIHVDDGIVLGEDVTTMNGLMEKLRRHFETKVNYEPKIYLGMEVSKTGHGIFISQRNYMAQVLDKYRMTLCKPMNTPITHQDPIYITSQTEDSTFPYRECVGSLLFASCKTRPDLGFAVNFESRSVQSPTMQDIINVKRTLRYLKGTQDKGILYSGKMDKLIAYCDSDFGGDKKDKKSTSGFIIFYGGGPVHWRVKKQSMVAQSSTEAEYVAAAHCCKQLKFLKNLLFELTGLDKKVDFYMDNQSAIKMIKSGQMSTNSNHIDIKYHLIHDEFKKDWFNLIYCPTDQNVADLMTKPLQHIKFQQFADKILHTK